MRCMCSFGEGAWRVRYTRDVDHVSYRTLTSLESYRDPSTVVCDFTDPPRRKRPAPDSDEVAELKRKIGR